MVCLYVIASVAKACRVEIDDVCDVKIDNDECISQSQSSIQELCVYICVSWWCGRLIGLLKHGYRGRDGSYHR